MRYDLLNADCAYRRRYVSSHDTIEAAIAAIPCQVIHWDLDAEHDAADAFAANGSLYVVEPREVHN